MPGLVIVRSFYSPRPEWGRGRRSYWGAQSFRGGLSGTEGASPQEPSVSRGLEWRDGCSDPREGSRGGVRE